MRDRDLDAHEGAAPPAGASPSPSTSPSAPAVTDDEILAWCRARDTFPQRLLSRERVMGVVCPECGSDRDENCLKRGDRGYRTSNHMGRVFDALRAFYDFR